MRYFYKFLLILFGLQICYTKILHDCRFVSTFYQTYSNIFELNKNQTLLTIRPLYSLSNQTFFSSINQTFSMGIIYRFAETYLVPVPLLFQCSESKQIYAPNDCEFTMIDTRVRKKFSKNFILFYFSFFFFSQIYQFEEVNQHVQRLFLFIFMIILHQIHFYYVALILNNQQYL